MGATLRSIRLWPSGIVPFRFEANFSLIDAAVQAMKAWELVANVRFVQRQRQSDFIEFVNHFTNSSCNSSGLGREGGRQLVRCSFGFPGTIVHEIGHAIGLIHEHQRSDRDEFVEVFLDRVLSGHDFGFRIRRNSRNGVTYDFLSIMHYSDIAFAKDGSAPPIVRIGGGPLNNSTTPTLADADFVRTMYPAVGVVRRSDSSHGNPIRIRALAAISAGSNRLVTAAKDTSDKLRLVRWQIGAAGAITRPSGAQVISLGVKTVDIAGADPFVTAVQSSSGRLFLISWRIISNRWQRIADTAKEAGSATQIRIVHLGPDPNLFATACRTREGRLLLITWNMVRPDGQRRLADSNTQAGAIQAVSMVKVRNISGGFLVATTVATRSQVLRTIVWRVSSDGGRIVRVGDSRNANGRDVMGRGTHIESVMTDSGHLLISYRTVAGRRLKLFAFEIVSIAQGVDVNRVSHSGNLAGRIGSNSLLQRPYGVLSAVSTAEGNLKLIKWGVSSAGRITRLADSSDQAGKIGLVSLARVEQAVGPPPVCTFVKAGNGGVFGISWDDESTTGELQ